MSLFPTGIFHLEIMITEIVSISQSIKGKMTNKKISKTADTVKETLTRNPPSKIIAQSLPSTANKAESTTDQLAL